jgi:hypothetical protein
MEVKCNHKEKYVDPNDLCCKCKTGECGCLCRLDNTCWCSCHPENQNGLEKIRN